MNKIETYLLSLMPRLGPNKLRELVRLMYEIQKRDQGALEAILPFEKNISFEKAKKQLLQKRYPINFETASKDRFYLPKLELDSSLQADLTPREFYPKTVYIENSVADTELAARVRQKFPQAQFKEWDGKTQVGEKNFSRRLETLVIHREKYDFLKPCPCSCGSAGCGYNLMNLGFGCRFECEYCFLQQYQNLHAVLLPANVEEFLCRVEKSHFNKGLFERPRIGSGEFTDSLVFDDVTRYSRQIVPFFRSRPHLQFEFKTKSINIDGLLEMEGCENVVISWSVNAATVVEKVEHFSASLSERFKAARAVARAGYRLGFHFDPVIIYEGYQQDYARTIAQMAQELPHDKIAWISVGTLRFSRELKKSIENRFPQNTILDGEFLLDFDGKMRYSDSQRLEVYRFLVPLLRTTFPKTCVYLCMEDPSIVRMIS
ncbi:MAG: hypothetical protein J5601_04180 [Elusimicrobiaceae bacterium]|nr:hypothetical protein [Elusimicrobiaceae bacterium]